MQFLVTGRDGSDDKALTRRMAAREAHLRLADELKASGEMLYGVALLNELQKMVGSLIVYEVSSRERLDELLKVEPYITGKVWEKVEVTPCKVGPAFL